MSRGTQAIIHLQNLRHNFKVLSQLASDKLVLVVKADAYGHGLKNIVKSLHHVSYFGVATLDEALRIRKIRKNVKILLLEGYLDAKELELTLKNRIDCVIHQQQQIDLLNQLNSTMRMNVWLKYDSGMNRLGFNDETYPWAIKQIKKHRNVAEIVLMSHFASADKIDKKRYSDFTCKQKQYFLSYRNEEPFSFANSPALLNNLKEKGEWCRTGLALFGVSPIAGKTAKDFNLKPVMSLKTTVIATKNIKKGQGVGYGQSYQAKNDMKIAIIGIGYGDGYPWSLSENAYVLLRNQAAKIVGKVSMDMMAIDVSHLDGVEVGELVLLWGQENSMILPVETVANNANTIPYVLLCQITSRVHYEYLE